MDDILTKLMQKQRKNINNNLRLSYPDLKRISKYVDDNFFTDKCCIWNTKATQTDYITFYYKKKKVSLCRILYYNFVDDLEKTDYLKYICDNKGKCCNVSHLIKKTKKLKNIN